MFDHADMDINMYVERYVTFCDLISIQVYVMVLYHSFYNKLKTTSLLSLEKKRKGESPIFSPQHFRL